jgi:hypothetical protein
VTGTVFLIGTVRSDRRAATSVTALWRDDRCHRVDLEHLPRDSVETLLHLALGAPVDGPAAHTLWSTSLGNVLFLRELVLGAQQSGALVDDDGVWRLARPLTSTPRLNDLVAARVGSVGENGRRALELLADQRDTERGSVQAGQRAGTGPQASPAEHDPVSDRGKV